MTAAQRGIEQLKLEEQEIGEFCFNKAYNAATDIDDQHYFAKLFDESELRYDRIRNLHECIRRMLAAAGVVSLQPAGGLPELDDDDSIY
jgi:hypothetical protein